jgi:hypothetical protein
MKTTFKYQFMSHAEDCVNWAQIGAHNGARLPELPKGRLGFDAIANSRGNERPVGGRRR